MFRPAVSAFHRRAGDLGHQRTLEKPRPFWAPLPA